MSKKAKNLRYLSRSVLLEEEGIPRVNQMIIVLVFLMVVSFIVWSLYIEMEEKLEVGVFISYNETTSITNDFILKIPSKDLGRVSEGQTVIIQINNNGQSRQIEGRIYSIDFSAYRDNTGLAYYQAFVDLSNNSAEIMYYVENLNNNLSIKGTIVGKRSLFVYLLNPIYRTLGNALNEP